MVSKPTCHRCRLFLVDRDGDLCECCRWRSANLRSIKDRTAPTRAPKPRVARAPSLKFGKLVLRNTEEDVLSFVKQEPGVSVETIVRRWYPETRQPHKKCKTFGRVLRRLERLGLVRRVGEAWYPAGSHTSTTAGGAA